MTVAESQRDHRVDVLNEDNNDKVGRIARSTTILVIAFATAKAISLVQTFIIAGAFGVGSEFDTYVTANRIPEQIVRLLAGGALGYAFIPIFSGLLAKGDTNHAWQLASKVMSLIVFSSFLMSIFAYIFAPWLVGTLLAPGFSPELQAQTVTMLRILLVSTMIFVFSSVITDTLEGHHHFLSPALAPIMFDVGILIGVIFLLEPLGIYGIAWGAVLGALMHLCVQLPVFFRFSRARWGFTLRFNDPVLWTVMLLMLPRVAGIFVASIDRIIANNFASRLGEGAVSAYNWGFQITQIPQTLLGTTLSIVLFPTLAALAEAGSDDRKRDAITGGMKFMLITTIPAAVGVLLVGRPLLSLLEGGAFDADATDFVYSALQYFTATIVLFSIIELVVRGFYADKDTWTPLWISFGGLAVHAIVAVSFSGLFFGAGSAIDMGVGGLALAMSLGMLVEVAILLWWLGRRWDWSITGTLGSTFVRTAIASLTMGIVVVTVGMGWDAAGLTGRGRLLTLIQVGVMAAAGALTYAGAALLLGIHEIKDIALVLLRRKKATVAVEEAIA
ncbi:MAG: murein biosynthesis integral membrane protein MurJ [Chloroflexota bacterium]